MRSSLDPFADYGHALTMFLRVSVSDGTSRSKSGTHNLVTSPGLNHADLPSHIRGGTQTKY